MYVGLVEHVWELQRKHGRPVSCEELAPFFHCPALAVPSKLRMLDASWPIQTVWNFRNQGVWEWDGTFCYWTTRKTHYESDVT